MNHSAAHALKRRSNLTETMMIPMMRLALPVLLLLGLAACQQEGPAERAGSARRIIGIIIVSVRVLRRLSA